MCLYQSDTVWVVYCMRSIMANNVVYNILVYWFLVWQV